MKIAEIIKEARIAKDVEAKKHLELEQEAESDAAQFFKNEIIDLLKKKDFQFGTESNEDYIITLPFITYIARGPVRDDEIASKVDNLLSKEFEDVQLKCVHLERFDYKNEYNDITFTKWLVKLVIWKEDYLKRR